MGAKAKKIHQPCDATDAIPLQNARTLSLDDVDRLSLDVDRLSLLDIDREQINPIQEQINPIQEQINPIQDDVKEEEKTDGAISTILTQQCNRHLSGKQDGNEKHIWIFLCFLLFILTLFTIIMRELATRLGEDHWIVTALNTTAEPLLNILI